MGPSRRKPQILDEELLELSHPSGRRHALVAVTENTLYMYGGIYSFDYVHSAQAWQFNLTTKKWKLIKVDMMDKPYIGVAPSTLNGCSFDNICRESNSQRAQSSIPLFFFCERDSNAESRLRFFMVFLPAQPISDILYCHQIYVIDIDDSLASFERSVHVHSMDHLRMISSWFLADSTENRVIIVRNNSAILTFEKEPIFQVYELKVCANSRLDTTNGDNREKINSKLFFEWKKFAEIRKDDSFETDERINAIAGSLRPTPFLWKGRKLCFIGRDRGNDGPILSLFSYVLQCDLITSEWTLEKIEGYSTCSMIEDPTLWPYTIFSNYLYLFAFESDDEQKDGNLILSTDDCNKIGDGALLRTNVFRLDMQNLRWESFSHYLSSTENSANHHLYAPYDSTAIFNAAGTVVYIFGGINYSRKIGADKYLGELYSITP